MKTVALGTLALLALAGVVQPASAEPVKNETSAFLGPKNRWAECTVVLKDIQGLWGGTAIYLDGSGSCLIRAIARGQEKRFSVRLSPDEMSALLSLCIDADLVAVKIKERSGVPDEARPTITLKNGEGRTFKLAKWAKDEVPRFDKVYQALLDLRKKTDGVKPEYEGKWQHDWKPTTAPSSK
jgi:hypothetical protein